MSSSNPTTDRDQKLKELKKSLAWICSAELFTVPLQSIDALKFDLEDDEELRQQKRNEHKQKLEARETERKEREFELLNEFDKIIERVKSTRVEANAKGNAGINYSAITEAHRHFKFKCEQCQNKESSNTVTDPKSGDLICNGKDGRGCGNVITDHQVFMGAANRNFEGEEDRNHFGPSPNKLMSDSWNMSTNLSVMKNGREDASFKKVSQAAMMVEMDLSNLGSNEHRTREGYKNKQKKEAFELIENLGDNLNIHDAVRAKAKIEFSRYRNAKEAIQHYNAVIAACIFLAYQDLSSQRDVDIKKSVFAAPRIPVNGGTSSDTFMPKPNPSDPSEFCLSDVPIAKWNSEQTKQWLKAVSSGAYDDFADAIIQAMLQQSNKETTSLSLPTSTNGSTIVNSNSSSGTSNSASSRHQHVKRNYDTVASFFGTTTIAGRNKMMSKTIAAAKANSNVAKIDDTTSVKTESSSVTDKSTAATTASDETEFESTGKKLVLFKFSSLSTDRSYSTDASEHFSSALRRRHSYEIKRKEAQIEISKDIERRKVNELMSTISSANDTAMHSASGSGSGGSVNSRKNSVTDISVAAAESSSNQSPVRHPRVPSAPSSSTKPLLPVSTMTAAATPAAAAVVVGMGVSMGISAITGDTGAGGGVKPLTANKAGADIDFNDLFGGQVKLINKPIVSVTTAITHATHAVAARNNAMKSTMTASTASTSNSGNIGGMGISKRKLDDMNNTSSNTVAVNQIKVEKSAGVSATSGIAMTTPATSASASSLAIVTSSNNGFTKAVIESKQTDIKSSAAITAAIATTTTATTAAVDKPPKKPKMKFVIE